MLYCWMVEEKESGRWGPVAAAIPGVSPFSPLVTGDLRIANIIMGPVARLHAERSGQQVALFAFTRPAVLEVVGRDSRELREAIRTSRGDGSGSPRPPDDATGPGAETPPG